MSKDDITPRELELVESLIRALFSNSTYNPDAMPYDRGYQDGYWDARDVMVRALKERGFDLRSEKVRLPA